MCLCQIARTHYLQEYNDPLYKKRNFNTCATRFPCRAFMRKSITIEDLVQNYEDKIQTDLVVLDFSKAFDVAPHQRLLHKLDQYGIRGSTLLWIQNFLTTRSQKVVVDGSFSDTAHVGSMLEQWADPWGMKFNPSKCSVFRVKRPRAKEIASDYQLKGVTLKKVSSTPYLGVSISENLEWGDHISKIASKANSTLRFLSINLKTCPSKLKEIAYFQWFGHFWNTLSCMGSIQARC